MALALGSLAVFGVTTASAAAPATVVLSGGDRVAVLTGSSIITASASVPGSVSFTANDLVIPGCSAVVTTVAAPFIARCNWTPSAEGSASLGATLTPADAPIHTTAIATPIIVKTGVPTQGIFNTITIYADTVIGPATGVLRPQLGGTCALTGNFMLGNRIIFRAYANDATRGGEALTSLNTLSATVTVAGVAKPIPLTYGTSAGRGGRGFWTAALQTGTAPGLYNTLGVVTFKITFIAKDSNSVKVLSTRLVALKKDGVRVVENGRTVYERVPFYKTISMFPAVKGATGTFESNMFPASSQVTVHPVPTA